MSTIVRTYKPKQRATVTAVILLAAIASGCASTFESDAYKFEIVGQPVIGDTRSTIAVRLVNISNERSVADAEVFALRTQFTPNPRAIVWATQTRVPLRPDGRGDFLYEGHDLHAGETLWLLARVAGEDSPIRGSVRVE